MRLKKLLLFLASLLVAWTVQGAAPNEHYRDALWVAESHGVLKLLAANGTLQIEIDSAQEVRSVAVDAVAGRVWVSRPKRLAAYGFDGESQLDVALEAIRPSADRHLLSVDRRDGTVWLARGKELQVVAFEGAPVASFAADRDVEAISLADQAGRRWLATKDRAVLRDEQGATLVSLDVPRGEKLHDLAYDPAHGALWLLTNKKLHFLDLESEQVAWTLDLHHGERVRLLKGDGAWVAGKKRLTRISPSGEANESFEYSQSGDLVAFVVDTMDGSLWLATQQYLGHYRSDGTVIDRLAFTGPGHTGRLWSLDMYIDDIPPSVRFALPEPGTLTNDNQLPFVLEYSDVGIGADPATIAFTVDDADAVFGCTEQGEGTSRCTPSQALPEGESRVLATVADYNGNVSDPAAADVTVDTIPPVITVSAPVDGAEVSDSPVTVAGRVNEPATLWVNGQAVALDGDLGFSSDVALEAGSNTIRIEASDLAGNTAHGERTVVLQTATLPPDPAKVATRIDPSKPTTVYDATRFLYEGPDPIQTDVEPGVIERKRVAVLRGKLLDRKGEPLPGVTVRAHGHPEYGTTMTRADGQFDLVVNGGGTVTVAYEKAGYMTVQRAVETPWRDYRWLPDVVMTRYDDRVTRIDLNADEPMQTARGTPVTDADGDRTATVMFPAGVVAEMVMPDGSREALGTLDVRATEYTVGPDGPDAMPGELPPTSAYTYAVELSVDQALDAGARSVEFSEPVPFYVENFLDFPVGIDVPTGYYDREKAQWIASEDGRIVEILDIVEGQAVLDVTGSGNPASADELEALQITEVELGELAQTYEVGHVLWRSPITHFTPWDCNWPYTFPEDAEPPEDDVDLEDQQEDDPCLQDGSIVECQNQVLGERIDIAGTPFTLNYRSNRAPGRRASYRMDIPVTGSDIPESLKRVEVAIDIVGRRFERDFSNAPEQIWSFEWDGKDAYGREPLAAQAATIAVRYVYDAVYVDSVDDFERSFGSTGDTTRLISDQARGEVIMEQLEVLPIGVWDARTQGLGGWTLNLHHAYEANRRQLFLGRGKTRRTANMNEVAIRVAGHPDQLPGSDGDGGPALGAHFTHIRDLASAPNGDIYLVDSFNGDVRKIEAKTGSISTVAELSTPWGIAIGPSEEIYVGHGDGVSQIMPDGSDKKLHDTCCVNDVAVGPDGSVYFATKSEVGRISSNGDVEIIAGEYRNSGYSGDGGPASDALLNIAAGVAVASDGTVYIADYGNEVVRRIRPNGIIETVAGTPEEPGYSGDGGPATEATLFAPMEIALDDKDALYIGDTWNMVIRKVRPDGSITTIAGIGDEVWHSCYFPDPEDIKHCEENTFGRNFSLEWIHGLTIGPEGGLYIADNQKKQIWRIEHPFPDFLDEETAIASQDGSAIDVFDSGGRHLRTLDVNTGAILYSFEYDEDDYLVSIADAHGNVTSVRRDDEGRPLALVAPFGQETGLSLNESGYLSRITDPLGGDHAFTYDHGLLRSVRNPNDNVFRYDYDADGRFVANSDPIGGGWALSRSQLEDGYDVTTRSAETWRIEHRVERQDDGTWSQVSTAPHGGSFMQVEEPNGTNQSATPDGVIVDSRLAPHPILGSSAPFVSEATMSLPGGQALVVERSLEFSGARNIPFGEHDIDETVTVNGRQYGSHFDAASRTWTRTSPEGRTTMVQLNEQGQVISRRLGSLAPVERQFNARGQVSQVNQSTRSTSLNYDGNGYLSQVVDTELRTTSLDNDRVGRTEELHLPGDRLVTFDFDANGNVTGITPPERPTHGFAYNGVDLATRYEPPTVDRTDSTVETDYRLDRAVGAVTRADGGDVDLAYGEATGLLTGIAAPQGTYSYTYLPNSDRLASATGPAGQRLDYAWNGPLVDQVSWSGEIDGQVDYAWNNNFWLDALTVNGHTIDYRYDNDGLVTGAGSLNLDYAPGIPLLESTDLGSVQTDWTYNEYGEPSSYEAGMEEGSTLYHTEFTRDRLGRITGKVETVGGVEMTYAYEYDAAGRLIEVRENGAVVDTYSYDANGNRLSHNGTIGTYDAQDRLVSYGDYNYTYTPDGELESKTKTATGEATQYTYDAYNNLRQVMLPGGTKIEYVIDAQNRRIGKKVDGTLVQGFLYGDRLNPVAELDENGNVVSIFVYASRLNVPDYMIRDGRVYRIVSDQLGSIRLVIDSESGDVVQVMDYSAFGRVTKDTNPRFQPFGFAGSIFDYDTRMSKFGARDYYALVGRWTSRDPISFNGGDWNLYGYVVQDPVNNIDPDGLEKVQIPWGQGTYDVVDSSIDQGKYLDFLDAQQCFKKCESSTLQSVVEAAIPVQGAKKLLKTTGNAKDARKAIVQACKIIGRKAVRAVDIALAFSSVQNHVDCMQGCIR